MESKKRQVDHSKSAPPATSKRRKRISVSVGKGEGVPFRGQGWGYPYAPENFPNEGDLWGWRVVGTATDSGFWHNRYLCPPKSILEKYSDCPDKFNSKLGLHVFLTNHFSDMDFTDFFNSFAWKIPAAVAAASPSPKPGKIKVELSNGKKVKKDINISNRRTCKLGNKKCGLRIQKIRQPDTSQCSICCIEPNFCEGCSCILCGKTTDQTSNDFTSIKCEKDISDAGFCGHIAHLECALASHMAGVEEKTGLDVEYYCRRCDNKTDLVKHIMGMINQACSLTRSAEVEDRLQLILKTICGTKRDGVKKLQLSLKSALDKISRGIKLQDISELKEAEGNLTETDVKLEDQHDPLNSNAMLSGIRNESLSCENDGHDTVGLKESPSSNHQDSERSSELLLEEQNESAVNINDEIQSTSLKLQNKIYHCLNSLKESQEKEYALAKEKLNAQKDLILSLCKQIKYQNDKVLPLEAEFLEGSQEFQELQNEFEKFEQKLALAILRRTS